MAKVSGQIKIYEMINNRIISLLENGEVPWQKPWVSGEPVNFVSKKPYRGINPFILISSGFSCPYWVSFKQVKGKGGMIKKGEKGFHEAKKCPFCSSDDLQPGAANATINRELSALKRLLNLGAKQTPPKVDRVPYIAMLKENNVKKGFFEHGDFLALRNHLPDHLKGFVTFCYKVGWRESEVTGLKWTQVDLHQGIVRLEVGETKNDEGRTVYLDTELKEIFKHQWELRKITGIITPYVFTNHAGKDKIRSIRGYWNTACVMAGIGYGYRVSKEHIQKWEGKLPKGPTLHDFRRTAVRNSIRAGVPERVAMTISGHKTRSVFDRYNIVNDNDLKKAAKAHEAYLSKQKISTTGTVSGTVHVISEIKSKQRTR